VRHGRLLLAALLLAGFAAGVEAHEVRPGYLAVRQTGAESFDVLWKVPARGEMRLGLHARLPEVAVPPPNAGPWLAPGDSPDRPLPSTVCPAR